MGIWISLPNNSLRTNRRPRFGVFGLWIRCQRPFPAAGRVAATSSYSLILTL